MKLKIKELGDFTMIHFNLENTIKPEELKSIKIPKVNPRKVVVIYDPRIGAVVVQSHADLKEGDVLDLVVEEMLEF